MSAQASVLGARRWIPVVPKAAEQVGRPGVRLATFSAFALYGTLRWETLLKPAPTGRMLGLLALTIALAASGAVLPARRRWFAAGVAIVAVIAMFPIAGVPFSWVRHVRIEVTANAIGQGLTALPNVLVPYIGINHWVRVVIVLGAAVLLLDAAVLTAFTPRSAGDLRRAGSALPLLALAVVPSTIVKPQLPYLQGLILFALLAAFMWAERAPGREAATSMVVLALAGVGGVIVAPRIDSHRAWFNYRAIAGTLVPAHVAEFDWSQTYGPLVWPHRGRAVFDVQAKHADYWKTENLDQFDGRGWSQAPIRPVQGPGTISRSGLRRWTQTIQVTIRAMRSPNVIAAGTAATAPTHISQGSYAGISAGTWIADSPLRPGDSYRVTTYSPTPTPTQLAAAGTSYPPTIYPYLELTLPVAFPGGETFLEPSYFPQFGAHAARVLGRSSTSGPRIVKQTAYARAYRLARRLKDGTATPYAFIERVKSYLANGYSYDLNPPSGQRFPLESFLFSTRLGYCQQFAGAMALLLRMGGVPARVSVGFTPGTYSSAMRSWVVTDTAAHAWVEVWFPGYGWVRFDPTPPASGGVGSNTTSSTVLNKGKLANGTAAHRVRGASTTAVHVQRGGSFPAWMVIVIAIVAAALAALIGLLWRRRVTAHSSDELLAELERALRRSGRPVTDGVTLVALERRFAGSPEAAGYVRAIRLHRYGHTAAAPTAAQRRALRGQLSAGFGVLGRLRAIWALPPRPVKSGRDG